MIRVGVNKEQFKVFDITNRTIINVPFNNATNGLTSYDATFSEDRLTVDNYRDNMSVGEMIEVVISRVEDTEIYTLISNLLTTNSKTIFGLTNISSKEYPNHFIVSIDDEEITITFVKGNNDNKTVNANHVMDNKGNKKSSLLFNLLCCKMLSCSTEMRYAQGYFNKVGKKMMERREKIKL